MLHTREQILQACLVALNTMQREGRIQFSHSGRKTSFEESGLSSDNFANLYVLAMTYANPARFVEEITTDHETTKIMAIGLEEIRAKNLVFKDIQELVDFCQQQEVFAKVAKAVRERAGYEVEGLTPESKLAEKIPEDDGFIDIVVLLNAVEDACKIDPEIKLANVNNVPPQNIHTVADIMRSTMAMHNLVSKRVQDRLNWLAEYVTGEGITGINWSLDTILADHAIPVPMQQRAVSSISCPLKVDVMEQPYETAGQLIEAIEAAFAAQAKGGGGPGAERGDKRALPVM